MAKKEKLIQPVDDQVVKRKFGGVQPGAGRPTKAEELKAAAKGIEAINKVYGSETKYWEFIATKAVESFAHLSLLHQYVYGRPVEVKELNVRSLPTVEAIVVIDEQ